MPEMKQLAERMKQLAEAHPNWRKGECAFQALVDLDAVLANKVRGGPADPFYVDHRIPRFWRLVETCWDPDPS